MRKIGIAVLLLAALPASAGLAGFQYQREIAVQENSGETLRDYQVLVALAITGLLIVYLRRTRI
ncbi:MAG: hypothetical protein U9N09_01365 [Euryarchaeota archaeon]|nr:hypothetical protein [Euryarchaeota archaeon]